MPKAAAELEALEMDKVRADEYYKSQLAILTREIEAHKAALYSKAKRAIKIGDYGEVKEDRRKEVFEDFTKAIGVKNKVHNGRPKNPRAWDTQTRLYRYFLAWITRLEKELSARGDHGLSEVGGDGVAFEIWCSRVLASHGWEVKLTSASGDQGVDLIAKKGRHRVAVQCKNYSGSVGNKAIQEALAGMTHFGLDHAVVVTTGRYTRSATALAETTGVLLLTQDDLSLLSERLSHLPK